MGGLSIVDIATAFGHFWISLWQQPLVFWSYSVNSSRVYSHSRMADADVKLFNIFFWQCCWTNWGISCLAFVIVNCKYYHFFIAGISPGLGHLNWSLPGLVFGDSGGAPTPTSIHRLGPGWDPIYVYDTSPIRVSCSKDTEWNTPVLYLRLISSYWAGYPPPLCRVSAWGGVLLKWFLLPACFGHRRGPHPPSAHDCVRQWTPFQAASMILPRSRWDD